METGSSPPAAGTRLARVEVVVDRHRFDAVVFDLDGVVTLTAAVHFAAWKEVFDELGSRLGTTRDRARTPFTRADYLEHVDGRPRDAGVRSYLSVRGIHLEEGRPSDDANVDSVQGLARRKDDAFRRRIERQGVESDPHAVTLLQSLRDSGVKTAVVSASRNARGVLAAAGLEGAFDVCVDGIVAADLRLPGKPHPAAFLEALRRLEVDPARAIVVEDAQAGVEAGRRAGFGLVVGVDRDGQGSALIAHGADVVVGELAQFRVGSPGDHERRQETT